MQYLIEQDDFRKEDQDLTVLSFSFRSGFRDQSTVCGMFRRLLHALLKDDTDLLCRFMKDTRYAKRCENRGKPGEKWDWEESELQGCFDRYVREVVDGGRTVRIYVDAIDESGEDAARRLVRSLRSTLAKVKGAMAICLSSRPYAPSGRRMLSPIQHDFMIDVQSENGGDIRAFLDESFVEVQDVVSDQDFETIKELLVERAAGVFQWLDWAVKHVFRLLELRESFEFVVHAVRRYPEELADVYQDVLMGIQHEEVEWALRLFEWLTLATRALTAEELRYAICLEDNKMYRSSVELRNHSHWTTSEEHITQRAKMFSGGLIREVPAAVCMQHPDRHSPGAKNFLQFDHESVREFMLDKGLQMLEKRLERPSRSLVQRHERIALRCLQYLRSHEAVEFARPRMSPLSLYPVYGPFERNSIMPSRSGEEPPFLRYGVSQWLIHALIADTDVSLVYCMATVLASFRERATAADVHLHISAEEMDTDRDMLCALIFLSLPRTLSALLSVSCDNPSELQNPFRMVVQEQDVRRQTPLAFASLCGYLDVVEVLLRHGADAHELYRVGWKPLHFAARYGRAGVVERLLAIPDLDVDATVENCGTPLHLAFQSGSLVSVELLVAATKQGLHSNVLGCWPDEVGRERTPLCDAFMYGTVDMLKVMLSNLHPNDFVEEQGQNSILHLMSMYDESAKYSHSEKRPLLVESGLFDLNLKGKNDDTPLITAVRCWIPESVELLLHNAGVNVDARDTQGNTPLHVAVTVPVTQISEQIVKLLVDSGRADINARNARWATPLHLAIDRGVTWVVRLLLDTSGIDPESQDDLAFPPLTRAARMHESGSSQVVAMLLDADQWKFVESVGAEELTLQLAKNEYEKGPDDEERKFRFDVLYHHAIASRDGTTLMVLKEWENPSASETRRYEIIHRHPSSSDRVSETGARCHVTWLKYSDEKYT